METHFLYLVLWSTLSMALANECTSSTHNKIEFVSCPSNCSQHKGRIPGDEVVFNCSIGVKNDVEKYKNRNKEQFLPESSIFDAPKILGVETYWKQFPPYNSSEQCLKLTFALPRGIVNPKNSNDWRLPKAVLLKFEGLSSGDIKDEFYTNCPRERIFQFHDYKTENFYEMSNPRKLEFDCLIGLTGDGYAITLQTAEGKTARYVTTVTEVTGSRWRPAIMTYLNVTSQSLYTVVEEPPHRNVTSYSIKLIKTGYGVIQTTKINVKEKNSTIFFNLTRGKFRVEVKPVCKPKCGESANFSVKSVIIDGTKLPSKPHDKNYPHYLEDKLEPMKVAAMVTGCIMGITLLLSITYCIRRRQKCHESDTEPKATGLLLHPFKNDSTTGEYEVILKLEQYVNKAFGCTVINSADIHKDHDHHIENLQNHVDKILADSSFILVLLSNDSFKSEATNLHTNFYSCVLKAAVKRRRDHNDLRIIPIRFWFDSNNDISPLLPILDIRNENVLDFIDNPNTVYHKIHGQERTLQSRRIEEENKTQWKFIWTDLKKAVNQVRNNYDAGQNEQEPLLPFRNQPIKMKDEIEPCKGSQIKKCFRTLMEINLDSESIADEEMYETNELRSEDSICNGKILPQFEKPELNKETINNKLVRDKVLTPHSQRNHSLHHSKFERTQNQPNVKTLKAEVHISNPLDSRWPDINPRPCIQPLSLPTNFPLGCQDEYHPDGYSSPEKHQRPFLKEVDLIKPDDFKRVRALNDSDSESFSDDSQMTIERVLGEEPDLNFPPHTIHGNINHNHRHHCQNRAMDRNDHIYPVENHSFYQAPSIPQNDFCSKRNNYSPRHLINQSHRAAPHNHGSHFVSNMYQRRPDNHNADHIPINGHYYHITEHQTPDIDRIAHYDSDTRHNENNHPNHYCHDQRYLNQRLCGVHCNGSEKLSLDKAQQSASYDSPEYSFKAVDPPAAQKDHPCQSDDIEKRQRKTKDKAGGRLQRTGSTSSLPTGFHSGNFLENFQNYDPHPPEEIDNLTDSQTINELYKINKNNL